MVILCSILFISVILGIYYLKEEWSIISTKVKSLIIAGIIIGSILMIAAFAAFLSDGSSGSGSYSSSRSSGGFVGSDGKYHSYVPEFGNDVNSWMAENW